MYKSETLLSPGTIKYFITIVTQKCCYCFCLLAHTRPLIRGTLSHIQLRPDMFIAYRRPANGDLQKDSWLVSCTSKGFASLQIVSISFSFGLCFFCLQCLMFQKKTHSKTKRHFSMKMNFSDKTISANSQFSPISQNISSPGHH